MEHKSITHSLARRVHCNFLISQEALQLLVNQLPKKRLLGPTWDKSSQSCKGRPLGRHTLYHLLLTLTPHKHAERTGFIASGLLLLIHSPYDCQNMLANIQHSAVPVLLLLHNLPWLPRTAGESPSPLWSLEIFTQSAASLILCCSLSIQPDFPVILPTIHDGHSAVLTATKGMSIPLWFFSVGLLSLGCPLTSGKCLLISQDPV